MFEFRSKTFYNNIFIPNNIIIIPTIIFIILEMFSGIKLDNIVPNITIKVKNISVEDTSPTENTISSFLFNLSSIIFVVNTLPQKTIVIGLERVSINP